MKLNGHAACPAPPQGLTDHQFDRLIMFYHDADGLRRGFQFWMGWMGGAEHGCDCVPVFLGPRQPNADVRRIFGTRSRKTLVLFSPPGAERVVELPEAVFTLLTQEMAAERCLVVLGEHEATILPGSPRSGASLNQLFGLGTFVACPDDVRTAGVTRAHRFRGPHTET